MSAEGLDRLVKAHEGYHTRQPDGSCKAYRCPAGVWTCGWGTTVGITPNTHWTEAEATEALAQEMRTHEAAVESMVTVPLNQWQFDALVSLSYNIGAGALKKSTLLRHLNAGDYARAASHFGDYKYAKVQGATAIRMKVAPGTSVVLPGLVERRANEAAMFLEAEPADVMAQKVEPPRTKLDVRSILTKVVPVTAGGGMVGTEIVAVVKDGLPGVPQVATRSLENLSAWKTFSKSFLEVGREGLSALMMVGRMWPLLVVAGLAGAALLVLTQRRGGGNGAAH